MEDEVDPKLISGGAGTIPSTSRESPLRAMTRSELDAKLGYMLFRLTLGINFLLHSFVRWGNLEQFANGLVADFAHTPLPAASVSALAYVIPFWEPIVGVLLILGLLTRGALVLGALLLAMFTLGSALRDQTTLLHVQLLYSISFFVLFLYRESHDVFGIDGRRRGHLFGKENVNHESRSD
jgi:thiosulfate dehydrogenase (quinone) large subunit